MSGKDTTTTTTEAPETDNVPSSAPEDNVVEGREAAPADVQTSSSPTNGELLDGVATASPHADRDPDTKVLGHDEVSPAESQERAKREALHNAQGEQDLH